jgi:hypothetical protein
MRPFVVYFSLESVIIHLFHFGGNILNNPIVGFTLAHRDGSGIGKWTCWMAYFMTIEEARSKATEHRDFLNDRGEDVVLVTLSGAVDQINHL